MLIWLNLLIPIIAILFVLFVFKSKISWWEYLLIFAIPLIAIAITKCASVSMQTFDKEFWNAYLIKAEYEEPWSTWDDETCTRTECTGSGDDQECHTETYDCSHCDNHYASWTAYDNLGNSHSISQAHFEQLCKIWNNRNFVDMHRSIEHHWSCGVDGDKYVTNTDGIFEHVQQYTDVHNYENKVQASRSVFNFQKIDTADVNFYGLFNYNYNFDNFNYNPIMGFSDPKASDRLQDWNSLLGSAKKIHMMILVFTNKTIDAAMKQESYIKGGNKNEFILCIGIDSNKKIQWTKVISWTEQDKLKFQVEQIVNNMNFDLCSIADTMGTYTRMSFIKKDFRDFKYITIEPTINAVMICFFVTLVLTIGLCIFAIVNPFTLNDPTGDDNVFNNRFRRY